MLLSWTDPPASVLLVDREQMAIWTPPVPRRSSLSGRNSRGADVELWLSRLPGDALVTAERAGVISALGEDNVTAAIRLASQTLRAENPGLARREGEDAPWRNWYPEWMHQIAALSGRGRTTAFRRYDQSHGNGTTQR